MKRLIAVLAFIGALLGNAAPMSRSNVNWVLSDLRNVADSPNYYWAWTYEWLNHAGVAGDMRNVVDGIGPSAAALMARLDALTDPERVEDANMLAAWREKFSLKKNRRTWEYVTKRKNENDE